MSDFQSQQVELIPGTSFCPHPTKSFHRPAVLDTAQEIIRLFKLRDIRRRENLQVQLNLRRVRTSEYQPNLEVLHLFGQKAKRGQVQWHKID